MRVIKRFVKKHNNRDGYLYYFERNDKMPILEMYQFYNGDNDTKQLEFVITSRRYPINYIFKYTLNEIKNKIKLDSSKVGKYNFGGKMISYIANTTELFEEENDTICKFQIAYSKNKEDIYKFKLLKDVVKLYGLNVKDDKKIEEIFDKVKPNIFKLSNDKSKGYERFLSCLSTFTSYQPHSEENMKIAEIIISKYYANAMIDDDIFKEFSRMRDTAESIFKNCVIDNTGLSTIQMDEDEKIVDFIDKFNKKTRKFIVKSK